MVCRDFILSLAYEPCLFLFAQFIVPYRHVSDPMHLSIHNRNGVIIGDFSAESLSAVSKIMYLFEHLVADKMILTVISLAIPVLVSIL